jgi:hypothetical protein
MSKVITAFASFMLGMAVTLFALSDNHTSTLAQAPPPQAPSPQEPLGAINAGGAGVPTVPLITQHFTNFGTSNFLFLPFGVDGTECVRCTFNNIALRYGGGNFQFTDFKFSGPVRIELTGAARNTVIFLNFVQGLAAGRAPITPAPTGPIQRTLMVKETVSGSFGTPK